MHTQVKTTDCTLSAIQMRTFERRVRRLERLVPRLDPDLVHLNLVVEHHPRRQDFQCSLRLTLKDRTLAARQHAPDLKSLLVEAFDRVEGQLKRVRQVRIDKRTRPGTGVEASMGE
jgi:ribosome-associated translation inhibitor RaiA